MFPTWPFMCLVAAFAAVLASAFDFSGVRGFLKNLAVSMLVLYGFVALGVLLGLVFHSAIFEGPAR